MPSFPRKIVSLLALALAIALAAAGCGGSEERAGNVPAGAIALVGEVEIPKSEFDRVIKQAEENFKAQNQEFPAAGTPEYENVKNAIVRNLVQRSEWEQRAAEMGIEVTEADVDKRLDELKQQFFKGNEKKYEKAIKDQGLTEEQVREQLSTRLLSEKIYTAVTKSVTIADKDTEAYYKENQGQFEQPASREVRHILVKNKSRAEEIYSDLQAGANFGELARRFSQDDASKVDGGKLTAVQGRTVLPFDRFVFSSEKGDLSQPIKTEFGWHVIEILSAVKPKSATPLAEVREQIRQTLLTQKQNQAMRDWVRELGEQFAGKVSYAPGYAPPQNTQAEDGETQTTG